MILWKTFEISTTVGQVHQLHHHAANGDRGRIWLDPLWSCQTWRQAWKKLEEFSRTTVGSLSLVILSGNPWHPTKENDFKKAGFLMGFPHGVFVKARRIFVGGTRWISLKGTLRWLGSNHCSWWLLFWSTDWNGCNSHGPENVTQTGNFQACTRRNVEILCNGRLLVQACMVWPLYQYFERVTCLESPYLSVKWLSDVRIRSTGLWAISTGCWAGGGRLQKWSKTVSWKYQDASQ